MRKLDYFLSYFYPISVEQTRSQWNPYLEIILDARKYALNSQNTNYSYGSLHTLFEKLFRQLKLNWNEINNVLILGFGAGSVASIIRKYKRDCIIDGVEIDDKVIELGKKYLNTASLKNVNIHCSSAESFIENCNKKFDLIVIDVYRDMNVPEALETEKFLISVKNAMNIGGMVVFNKFNNSKTSRDQLPFLKELYEKVFKGLTIITIMITGKIFIAKKLTEN